MSSSPHALALADRTLKNYRVGERLGGGGMGTVHRAVVLKKRRGLEVGQEVAIKFLHPHLAANEDILKRFRREAGLGTTIRHPRVMAVHDVGAEDLDGTAVHFIVMELLRGKTLRTVLDEKKTLTEAEAVRLGMQVAEGLAEIHSKGAVHRDIKPGNVFVDDAGAAKIADLGLSRLVEPSTEISLPGTFLGSVAYAAPEQARGDAVGPPADLYALGVTLYEAVAGINPFVGKDLAGTLRNHIDVNPPPLARHAPEASWFFERLLSALLVKEPKARIAPAGRVARVFEERESSEWWKTVVNGEGDGARLSPGRRLLRVRRQSRVHGRRGETERLVDVLRTSAIGKSGAVGLILGEAGSGKSRLIDAALESMEAENIPARVFVSRFLDLATPVPCFPLNEALLQAFDLKDKPRPEVQKRLPRLLKDHLPERRVFAEAFAALIDDKDRESALAQLPGDAIPALYAEAFRTVAARSPLVIVIEELQWADPGSLRALEKLLSSLSPFPIALVLTARNEVLADAEGDSPRAKFVRRFLSSDAPSVHLQAIHLPRLDQDAVRGIVRDLAVPEANAGALAERLHDASGGNAEILFALVDELERRGRLRDPRGGETLRLDVPASVNDLIDRRIEDLDPDARRFLEFASVFGARFKPEPVISGLGLDLVTASEILARLTQRFQVVRAFDKAYRFDQHLLHDRLYRAIEPARKREYHAAVGAGIAREISDAFAPIRTNYEAGIHFSLAEEHARAARHLVGAVGWLSGRSQHERAERLAAAAVAHAESLEKDGAPLPPIDRFRLYECHAAVTGHLGRRDEQGASLLAAARAAHESGDLGSIGRAEWNLARYHGTAARVFAALQHCENARSAATRAGDPALIAAILRVEADVLRTMGATDYEDRLRDADRLASEAKDESGRAFGLLLMGQLFLDTDRPSAALKTLKESLESFERQRDQRGRGRAFFQLARVYRDVGDLARAQKAVNAAERVAAANSDRLLAARCISLNGDLALRRRDYALAKDHLHAALAELEHADDRGYLVTTLVTLSILHTATRFAERSGEVSAQFATRAVNLARSVGITQLTAYAYTALALAHLASGNPTFAFAVSRKNMKVLEDEPLLKRRTAEMFFVHYRCAKALGRTEDARQALLAARDIQLERAREIREPVYRKSFREGDLFNAAVLREAARVLGD